MVNGSEQAFLFLFGERCDILEPFEHSGIFKQVGLFVLSQ